MCSMCKCWARKTKDHWERRKTMRCKVTAVVLIRDTSASLVPHAPSRHRIVKIAKRRIRDYWISSNKIRPCPTMKRARARISREVCPTSARGGGYCAKAQLKVREWNERHVYGARFIKRETSHSINPAGRDRYTSAGRGRTDSFCSYASLLILPRRALLLVFLSRMATSKRSANTLCINDRVQDI